MSDLMAAQSPANRHANRRRSCKHVEKHLFESFAKEFFTKRQFMIEHASLKTLVEISNHPILSQRLEEVLISTDMFDDALNMDPKYSLEFTSREWLLRSGQARDMLAEAFSKLKSLRSVGLRDYNAIGRSREGPDGLWRSYGKLMHGLFLHRIRWQGSPCKDIAVLHEKDMFATRSCRKHC